jgi:two-component system nitrogen regulation response regulator NtrX
VETFLDESAGSDSSRRKQISGVVLKMLQNYHWPGNVRELKNLIERLVIMSSRRRIDIRDLPAPYDPDKIRAGSTNDNDPDCFDQKTLEHATEAFRQEYARRTLSACDNDFKTAAQQMRITEQELVGLLDKDH